MKLFLRPYFFALVNMKSQCINEYPHLDVNVGKPLMVVFLVFSSGMPLTRCDVVTGIGLRGSQILEGGWLGSGNRSSLSVKLVDS